MLRELLDKYPKASIAHIDNGENWPALADEIDRLRRIYPGTSILRRITKGAGPKIILGGTADLGVVGTYRGLPVELRAEELSALGVLPA